MIFIFVILPHLRAVAKNCSFGFLRFGLGCWQKSNVQFVRLAFF